MGGCDQPAHALVHSAGENPAFCHHVGNAFFVVILNRADVAFRGYSNLGHLVHKVLPIDDAAALDPVHGQVGISTPAFFTESATHFILIVFTPVIVIAGDILCISTRFLAIPLLDLVQ